MILVVTPGSTTAVVVRNTLGGGSAAGIAAAAGAAVGNTTHATAAGLGLALVFARWPIAMTMLRVGGALFLAWLGVLSLYRVARFEDGGIRLLSSTATRRRSTARMAVAIHRLSARVRGQPVESCDRDLLPRCRTDLSTARFDALVLRGAGGHSHHDGVLLSQSLGGRPRPIAASVPPASRSKAARSPHGRCPAGTGGPGSPSVNGEYDEAVSYQLPVSSSKRAAPFELTTATEN